MKANFLISDTGRPYKPAKFVDGKRKYIEYWMYHQIKGKAVRRRFYQIKGNTPAKRREHAKYLVKQINKMLQEGYIFGKQLSEAERSGVVIPNLLEAFEQIVALKQVQHGTRTAEAYRSFFNVFKIWYAQITINPLVTSFKKKHAHQFLDWLSTERTYRGKKGVSNVTRNNYLDILRATFEALIEREIIKENPAKGIKDLKEEGRKYIAFTDEQRTTIEKYLKTHDYDLFIYTRFIYYCFLRPAELLRLRIRHIDIENRTINVTAKISKTNRQGSVIIPKPLFALIEKLNLKKYPSDYYIFSKPDLRPGPSPQVRNRVSERHTKALKACGLYNGELNMYGWKHTGNKNAYLAGVDIKTIQMQNRHSNLAMTDVYLRDLGVRIEKDLLDKDW